MGCEVSNLEYIKTFTPFLLAIFVYFVWHFQKSNEVLASESKNLISQINELMQLNSEIMSIIRNSFSYKSEENLKVIEIKMNDFEIKTDILLGTFNFLILAIGESKTSSTWIDWIYGFKRAHVMYCIEMTKINSGYTFQEDDENLILNIHNELVMNCNRLKKVFLTYAMYRNTWLFKLYTKALPMFRKIKS